MKKLSKFIYFIFAFALITCMAIFNPAIDFASADSSTPESKTITISNASIIDSIDANTTEGLVIPLPQVSNATSAANTFIKVTDRSGVKYLYNCKTGDTLDENKQPLSVNYFVKLNSSKVETTGNDVAYIKVANHGQGSYKVQYVVEDGDKTFYSKVKTVQVTSVAYSWNFTAKGQDKNIIPATTKSGFTHKLPLPTIENSVEDTTITYTKADIGDSIVVTKGGFDVTGDVLTPGEDGDDNIYFKANLVDGKTSDTYIIKYKAKETENVFPDKTFTIKVTKDYETTAKLEVTHSSIVNVQQGAVVTFPTANVTDKTNNKSNVEVSTEIIIKQDGKEDVVLKNQYDYKMPVPSGNEKTSEYYITVQYRVTDAYGNVATSKETLVSVPDNKPHTIAFAQDYTVNFDDQTGETTFENLVKNAEYLIPNEVGYGGFYVPAIYAEDYVDSYQTLVSNKYFSRKLVATDGSGLEFDIDSEDNGAYAANVAAGKSYNNVVRFEFTPKSGKDEEGNTKTFEISDYAGMTFELVYSVKDSDTTNTAREATVYKIQISKDEALANNVDKNLIINFATINGVIDPTKDFTFTSATAKEDPTGSSLVKDERVQVRTFYYFGTKAEIEAELASYIAEKAGQNADYIEKYGYDFASDNAGCFYNRLNTKFAIADKELTSVDGKTTIDLDDATTQPYVTIFAVAINDQGQFVIKAQQLEVKKINDSAAPTVDTDYMADDYQDVYEINQVAQDSKFNQNLTIKIPGLKFTDGVDGDDSLKIDVKCYVDKPEQTVGISIEKFFEGCGIQSAELTTTYAGTYYIVYTATDDAGNQTSYISTFEVAKTEKAYIEVENGANISKNVGDEVVLNINLAGNGVYDNQVINVTWGDDKPSGQGSVAHSYTFDKAGTYVATITAEYTLNGQPITDTPPVTVTITVTEPKMEWASDVDEILVDRTADDGEVIRLYLISVTENGQFVPATPSVVFVDKNDKEVPVELTYVHGEDHWTFKATEDGVYKVTYTATTQYNTETKSYKITCGDYYKPTITLANNKLQDSNVIYKGQNITLTAEFKAQTSNDQEQDMKGKYTLTVVGTSADGKEMFNYDIDVDLKDTDAQEQTSQFTPSSWSLSLSGDNASSKTTVTSTKSKWTISGVGSYELSLTVKDANGNDSEPYVIKFTVSNKTEAKTIKDEVVGIILIVVSVVLLAGVIAFFAFAGKRNKAKRPSIKSNKD